MLRPQRIVVLRWGWTRIPSRVSLPGLRLRSSYLYDDQIYTDYTEQLTTGTTTGSFNRSSNRIPGVQPNYLNGRIIYHQPSGILRGLGASWR